MKRLSLVLTMVFFAIGVSFSQKTVTGTVTDASNGETIIGASVVVKGTTKGTVTDGEGRYSLNIPSESTTLSGGGKTTLVFSFVGFATQEVAVTGDVVDVQMSGDATLQEVVVTGTGGAIDKRLLGVEVQSLKAKDLPAIPNNDISQALVGNVAGAQISSVNGSPGARVSILLRGINSVNSGTQPMTMMDGLELGSSDLNSVDLTSLGRVEIAQGAASAGLYGAQGANGVIQLFTKRGEKGATRIDYSTSYAQNTYLNVGGLRKADLHGFRTNANNEVIGGSGNPLTFNPNLGTYSENLIWSSTSPTLEINKPYDKNLKYIDHFKVFLQSAPTINHSLAISGATDKVDYWIGASRNYQQSNFVNNGDFTRSNLTANIGVELAKGLTMRSISRLIYTDDKINDGGGRNTIYALFNSRPFADFEAKLPDGNYPAFLGNAMGVNGTNPFFANQYSTAGSKKVDIVQNLNLNYKPAKWLELDAKYGINYRTKNATTVYRNQSENVNVARTGYWWYNRNDGEATGEINRDEYTNRFTHFLTSATFSFDLPKNILSTTYVAFDYRNRLDQEHRTYVIGLPTHTPFTMEQGAPVTLRDRKTPFVTFGTLVSQRFIFGQVAGITAGIRSDYSSAFGRGSKAFTFPRGDVFFNLSGLDFWKNSKINSVVEGFKLRAAYGSAGIQPQPFDRYPTLDTRTVGTNTAIVLPSLRANPDLEVEISKELEYGAEIAFKLGRGRWLSNLTFAPTYWSRKTSNAIIDVDEIPSIGLAAYKDNAMSLESHGLQFQLGLNVLESKTWNWDLKTSFGQQTSIISDIKGQVIQTTGAGSTAYVLEKGTKVGQLFGFLGLKAVDQVDPTTGKPFIEPSEQANYVVASNGWVANKTTKAPYFTEGQYSFGDPNPDFIMNFINTVSYKDIASLRFQIDWVEGSHLYNQTKEWMYRDGIHSDYQQPITIDGKTGAWSAFYRGVYAERARNGTKSYFYEDASFVRLRNLSLNINLEKIIPIKICRNVQLSLVGRNLWTKTKYTGMDPEVNSSDVYNDRPSAWDRGTDHNTMPNLRSYQVGLNIGF